MAWNTLHGAVTARILESILRLPLSGPAVRPRPLSISLPRPFYSAPDSIDPGISLRTESSYAAVRPSGTLRLILCTRSRTIPSPNPIFFLSQRAREATAPPDLALVFFIVRFHSKRREIRDYQRPNKNPGRRARERDDS